MSPEEKQLLEKTYSLTVENNNILKKLDRARIVSMAVKVSYWVIIIALSFGAFYFIQPYLDALQGNLPDLNGVVSGF